MKLLVNIDQKKSIELGVNAPNSTEVIEFDAAQIPEDIRQEFARGYDPKTGALSLTERRWKSGYHSKGVWIPAPASFDAVIGEIRRLLAEAHEEQKRYESEQAEKEAKAKADAAAYFAEVREHPWKALKKNYFDGARSRLALVEGEANNPLSTQVIFGWDGAPEDLKDLVNSELEAVRLDAAVLRKQREAENLAREKRFEDIIRRLGTAAQVARLERGIMKSPKDEALALLTDSVFRGVKAAPLDAPLRDPDDIDDDESMAAYLAAEQKVKEVVPDAETRLWQYDINHSDEDAPAEWAPAIEVSRMVEGFSVKRAFAAREVE